MSDNGQKIHSWNDQADWYASKVDTKPHNAYYERPATLSLLPNVNGMKVLDAGCGPGVYTELLLNCGAQVVAIDVSEKMIHYAKQRVGNKATFYVANLSQPLHFLESNQFNLVLSSLVLDSVERLDLVFNEFYRVLKTDGFLVFSIGHPLMDFKHSISGNYFANEKYYLKWSSGYIIQAYRRPMGFIITTLLDAKFSLEKFVEPRPVPEFEKLDPESYQVLIHKPGFLCIRARKIE